MSEATVDAKQRDEIARTLATKIADFYVFPEAASTISQSIEARRERGEYSDIDDNEALASLLTQHIQQINGDQHLRVEYRNRPSDETSKRNAPTDESNSRERTRLANNCIQRLERLAGNVGYMKLVGFVPPDWGADTLVACMAFLSNSSALIVDLRACGGGDVRMVQVLCSYFFDRSTHLNSFYWRPDNATTQSWTMPHVPGARMATIPVLILTSHKTFSAGEDFAYTLQALGRARIVGEATRGGAHPGEFHKLHLHFDAFIPCGRPINPLTGTNWEGTGVIPDVATSQEAAFEAAYALALQDVIDEITANPRETHQGVLDEARNALTKRATQTR